MHFFSISCLNIPAYQHQTNIFHMRSLPNGILGRWRSVNLTTIWEMHADPWKMSGHDDLEMHGPGTFYKTALKTWNDPHLNFLVHNQMRASQQTTYLTCVSCGKTFTQVLLRKTRTRRNSTVHLNSKLTSLSHVISCPLQFGVLILIMMLSLPVML